MPQGGILSPFLFNVYLDYCLNEIPELKEAVEAEIIVCFADDMIARVKSIQQAEKLIKGLEKLKKFGLDLNKSKSQILGGVPCLEGKTEILRIPIHEKVTYLGYTFSRTRSQLYSDTRKRINKHINWISGKLSTIKNEQVKALIHSSFGRSLIVYFATPLVACGAWDMD